MFVREHQGPLFQPEESEKKGQQYQDIERLFLPFFAPDKIVNHQKSNRSR
jgi:hypothetical protein